MLKDGESSVQLNHSEKNKAASVHLIDQ